MIVEGLVYCRLNTNVMMIVGDGWMKEVGV